ncbi:MAG TPA: methyltransferase domain-containing protein, partial [Methylomirabilota bacterium]|nr:methyltransferase domain-containing protein [Methylomirabilota bacterium]
KFKQGQYEVALDFALKALRDKPNHPDAERLRIQAASKLRIADGSKAAIAIYQLLEDYDEPEKAATIIANLPYELQKNSEVLQVYERAKQRVQHLISDEKYQEYFSSPPHWEPTPWEGFEKGFIPGRDRYEYILSRLKKNPGIKKVLIVGCDDGYYGILLAKEGYEVSGIDLNEEAIRIGNERAEKLGVKAKFRSGWFEKLNPSEIPDLYNPLETWQDHFDAVIASEQIEKVKNVPMYLGGLGDCIKSEGKIILTTPEGSWEDGDIPYSRKEGEYPPTVRAFTQETLELILSSNKDNFFVSECHFLPYSQAYKENQGWLVGELIKGTREISQRIHIVCGNAVETFTPLNLRTGGIGGSETAVIQMADSWTRLGAGVVVYRSEEDIPHLVGIFDGVYYRNSNDWSPDLKCDLLVSWRLPHIFAKTRPNAKRTVLWCHDIHSPIEIKPEWVENIDVIAVLSEWHKKHIMGVHPFPEEKVWVTRNGIDPTRFGQKVSKKP